MEHKGQRKEGARGGLLSRTHARTRVWRKRSFRGEAGEAGCQREAATGSRWESGRT